jgi:hypothetical protein
MKLNMAIDEVTDAETELARKLHAIGERHAAEHDLYHMSHTLARQCADHLEQLAPVATKYGARTHSGDPSRSSGLLDALRRTSARLTGRAEASGLLLLNDLRSLYLNAQHAEICWVILLQAAKAARDQQLIELVTECHEHAELRGKWLRTRIKETAPQALATG